MSQPDTRTANGESKSLARAPSEEIKFSFTQCLLRSVLLGFVSTTIIAALVAILFCVIIVSTILGGGLPAGHMAKLPMGFMYFFGFGWCCIAVVAFPVSLFFCLSRRSCKAWAEGKL